MISKIIKLGASWCHPCEILSNNLKEFTRVPVVEVDVDTDEGSSLSSFYRIRSVPTLIFNDENDKEVMRVTGLVSIADINKRIDEYNGKESKNTQESE